MTRSQRPNPSRRHLAPGADGDLPPEVDPYSLIKGGEDGREGRGVAAHGSSLRRAGATSRACVGVVCGGFINCQVGVLSPPPLTSPHRYRAAVRFCGCMEFRKLSSVGGGHRYTQPPPQFGQSRSHIGLGRIASNLISVCKLDYITSIDRVTLTMLVCQWS